MKKRGGGSGYIEDIRKIIGMVKMNHTDLQQSWAEGGWAGEWQMKILEGFGWLAIK